ncbi:MAG: CoA pyrophosphatase [Spirochaetes bacterium]|nr:CoA pyrophosphatase [Spirochaetota bacterium]
MKQQLFHQLLKKLPSSPHILRKNRYRNTAVLVPFIFCNQQCHLLFQKRAPHIRQGGEVSFPGGIFDPDMDKDLKETAIRETVEELGIKKEQILLKGQMDSLISMSGITVDPFVAQLEIDDCRKLPINHHEVDYLFSVPFEFFINTEPQTYPLKIEIHPYTMEKGERKILFPAKELGLPERYHQIWGSTQYQVLVYQTADEVIWGITAEIICDLVEKINEQ